MIKRLVGSAIVVILFGAIMSFWSWTLPQLQGISAAKSINDDSVTGNSLSQIFRHGDPIGLILILAFLGILALIWIPFLAKKVKDGALLALVIILAFSITSTTACAGRATTESERNSSDDVITVAPNQTAFVIPATGGNLSGQEQFDSEKYLESKKVASKRVTIQKELLGSKYVPKFYVILVDRTPVARQWTKTTDTGTTAANEALCAESNESIEVCFQISMAASVLEESASTYLYNFPTTTLKDPQVGGVFMATPLANVVDNQVRQYAQRIIGEETARRTLRQIITEKAQIISKAEVDAKKYFATQGVTISYLGLGGQLVLSDSVQSVINELFVAQQNIEISKSRATVTAIDAEAARNASVIRAQGDAQALKTLNESLGGDATKLAGALESYRWNGSRVIVTLGADPSTARIPLAIPVPTATPIPVQPANTTPGPTATPKK